QQRFPQPGIAARLVAFDHLGDGQAEFLRQHAYRILKADLLVQFQELEYVAADAAAEAVEESLLGIDMKRGRLLTVKWAEPLVGPPRPLQRDVLLDDRQEVRLKAQVVNKGLRKKRHPVLGSAFLVLRSWFYVLGSSFLVLRSASEPRTRTQNLE